ncbi:hypothetical protein [Geobacter sp.]|uniref:hypothetical protein n=1 Tax=Geobacter sp. TaxID=46610 RepID=UPI00262F4FF9|nr:hypothetical protein [Geobacter sp.]
MTGKSDRTAESRIEAVEGIWKKLWSVAAFITGIIGSFWVSPPYIAGSDQAATLTHFAKFVVAAIVALMLLPMVKRSDRQAYAILRRKIAAAALVVSIVAFFGYQRLYEEWVVTPMVKNKKLVLVTGSRVVDRDVREFMAQYSSLHKQRISNWELLHYAAWSPWKIWTKESILRRRRILSVLYVLITPVFAVTMVAIAQAISCTVSRE